MNKNMNKNTKKRYQGISKPLLSGAVFVASVGIIWAGTLAASSSLYNLKAENPSNQNRLTAENRDALVTEVENLKNQISRKAQSKESETNEGTPSGAVMAFDSENCPEGWTRFADADWRFIMGTSPGYTYYPFVGPRPNVKTTGGNNTIKLTISQLPPHRFYLFANESATDRWYDRDRAQNREHRDRSVLVENNHDRWDDNYSYTMGVSSDQREASVGRTNTLWKGNNIDITNPYIKLLYCKKN